MANQNGLEIYFVVAPGLETALAAEFTENGFAKPRIKLGGLTVHGLWPDVWRAHLMIAGATRILVRLASFRAAHLSELDKRARRLDWAAWIPPGSRVQADAICRKSRIYHSGAAAERVETAAARALGAPRADAPEVTVKVRLERDVCTLSLDATGEPLHKRGWKTAVARAPMRETLAALFLREAGYSGAEPVLDPMCGSGTFVIEAASRAAGLAPGRARSFAFERFATFDPDAYAQLRASLPAATPPQHAFLGFDRDAGAVQSAEQNAARAGVSAFARFERRAVAGLTRPDGPPGLVIVNPPYGARIGDKQALQVLHRTLGERLKRGFSRWRVALITSDARLAKATGLRFSKQTPPVDHGGLRVRLHLTEPLD